MNLPGKTVLKICGILMIISSSLAIIVSLIGLIPSVAATASGVDGIYVAIAFGIGLVSGIISLIVAIFVVKNANNKSKAMMIIILGAISILITLIGGIVGKTFSWSTICSMVIPALVVLGGVLNKTAKD